MTLTDTGAALLAAIIANPGEDTPRLMFADWCEESGDPGRAEFIRRSFDPPGPARRKRLRKLLYKGLRDWFPPHLWRIPGLPPKNTYTVEEDGQTARVFGLPGEWPAVTLRHERGFVWRIKCTGRQWLMHHAALRAAFPLTRVALATRVGRVADADLARGGGKCSWRRAAWPTTRTTSGPTAPPRCSAPLRPARGAGAWPSRCPRCCPRCGPESRLRCPPMSTTSAGTATVALDLLPKAREVWRMMAEGDPPLMAHPAVDMLLDETDGAAHRRGECVRLLWVAAAEWIEELGDKKVQSPRSPTGTLARTAGAARRGAWTVLQGHARECHKAAVTYADNFWHLAADYFFAVARRTRTAARLVRDLKRCL